MNQHYLSTMFFTLMLGACAPHQIGVMDFPQGEVQHVVRAEAIAWQPCPPGLPEGCEIAILEGHPKQADLFTVRFRLSEKFEMRPHTHPKDERVTILDGQVRVAFGEDARRQDAALFNAGDYYVNSRDAVHSVWIDKPAIIQITGIGPWQANFVSVP